MSLHIFGPFFYYIFVLFVLVWSIYIFLMLIFSLLCVLCTCPSWGTQCRGRFYISEKNANTRDMGLYQIIMGSWKYSGRSGKALWGKLQFGWYLGVNRGQRWKRRSNLGRRKSIYTHWRSVKAVWAPGDEKKGSGAGPSGVRCEEGCLFLSGLTTQNPKAILSVVVLS